MAFKLNGDQQIKAERKFCLLLLFLKRVIYVSLFE